MNFLGTALTLVLLSFTAQAARTNNDFNSCSVRCSSSEDSLFKPGQKYIYSYKGESNIKTTSESYDSTGVLIKSKVTITGLSNCAMKLSMSDVQVFDKMTKEGEKYQKSPNSGKIKTVLEQYDVLFRKEDQKVQTICMDKNEPVWSENIKKVLIDTLANQGRQTPSYEYQTTSHGRCFIHPTLEKSVSNTPEMISFIYDIKTCENKKMPQSIFTDLAQVTAFDLSQVTCNYVYQNQEKLESVKCKEEYRMNPLKQNGHRVIVEITSSLQKEQQIESTDKTFDNKNIIETGIEQNYDEMLSEESSYTSVRETLKQICANSAPSSIPELFMKLVNQLKDLTSKEFKEINIDVSKNDICTEKSSEIKSIFFDAVGFVNTPASVSVMVELIKTNQISLFDQNVWLTSLSFMQQSPTIEMLKDLESLISVENPTTPMYLGISSVTHLYCKKNYKTCLSDPTIKTIVSRFLQNLNKDCSLTKDVDLSKIHISLKALENLKLFTNEVVTVLKNCVSTKTNPQSVRISALEIMKHMDCQKDRRFALEILENNENDSELRINAYLMVMGCSDINTLFKVREILAKEKVNQVGSFIWTHLTNIKESSDSLKKNIKELLNNVELKKEFDISKLKFSRNIEKTFKLKNLGMTFDSNVIFSEKSFIPRSVSLNTTTLILNRPTNFIEMSARLEGLEDLLYKLFGPEGYLKKKTSNEDNLALIKLLNEISGSMNIKLYGQQISFIELLRGSIGSVKKYNILQEIMNWNQEKSLEINKNLQLIDKTAVLPTLMGFPLEFKLQGSLSLNIKVKSQFDITSLLNWPTSFNIDTHISPNINSEFNTDVVLNTPFSKYGMRLNLKSGTNTEFKATIFANKYEAFSIKFDTPKVKQDIVFVEGNAYVVHRNNKIPQLIDKIKESSLCSSDETVRILGVKFCGTVKYMDPSNYKNALLYGPFSADLFIKKEDDQTGYIIQGSSKTVPFISESGEILRSRFIKFEFDTPNSKTFNRRFTAEYVLDYKEKLVKFEMSTPWNSYSMMTKFKLLENEKSIGVNLQMNKQNILKVKMENFKFFSSKKSGVNGEIEISAWTFTPIRTKWNYVSTDRLRSFSYDLNGLMKDDTKFKLEVSKLNSERELSPFNKYQMSGFYNSFFGNGKISGLISENYYGHRWDIKLNHKPKDKLKDEFNINFRHKTEDKSSKNLNKFLFGTTFSYGKNYENFIKLETTNELSDKHIRTGLKFSFSKTDNKNGKPLEEKLELDLYGGHKWKDENSHLAEGSLTFKFPSKNINYEGRYNSEVSKRMFKLSLAFDKNQQSTVNLKINYLQPKLYLKDTDLEATFSLPNNNLNIKWNLKEIDVNKYKYTLESKYNMYDMKINGVQTRISTLEHDSSISIEMPRIEGVPKKVNVKFRINLVNLAKATIESSLDIPNTIHQYSVNTQFSFLPDNLLQLSGSEITSVFKYDIEITRIENSIKSKFVFTCNPEEYQTYFNLDLNSKNDKNEPIEFDIHVMHKNPSHRLYNSNVRLALQYPGNSHSVGMKYEFKYTEMQAQIDLTWNKNRRISVNTMYELDNSWTQKGLTGSVTIKTPFPDFEQIHFGVNAVGQLRYRKVDLEIKWGSNKKILLDMILQPRSSNDFIMSFKIVTPFQGFNLLFFQTKHMYTSTSINTNSVLEIGPNRRYMINFEAINNSEEKNRDIMSSIEIVSGIYPPFKMSILHKDNSITFKSQFDVTWMKSQFLKINSDVSYSLENYQLTTKGDVILYSTLKAVKQMKTNWVMENQDGQFSSDVQLLHNFKNILKSTIKGFYEMEPGLFKTEFSGVASVLDGRSMKIASNIHYEKNEKIQNQFSVSHDTTILYSHNVVIKNKIATLKVFVSNSKFKTIEMEHKNNPGVKSSKDQTWIKIGEKLLMKLENEASSLQKPKGMSEIRIKSKFYSDYTTHKEIETKVDITFNGKNYFKIQSKTRSELKTLFNFDYVASTTERTNFQISLESMLEELKNFNLHFGISQNLDGSVVGSTGMKLNDIFEVKNKVIIRDLQLINIDSSFRYLTYSKYLKFKHVHHVLGYEHLLDCNLFGKKIKFSSSTELRGGLSLHGKFEGDLWFLKSFEVFGQFSKESELKIIYKLLKDSKTNEKIKLSYSNKDGLHKLVLDTTSFLKSEIQVNLRDYNTIAFDLKNFPIDKALQIKLKFNYEGGKDALKHSSQLKFSVGDRKFEIENKLEKVKWKYLLIESELKTNFFKIRNHKMGFEYKLRPSKFTLDFKLFCNERFIKLSTNFASSSDSKMEIKLETSFQILQEITLELKQKQNELYTQLTHKCQIIVKTQGSLLKIENDLEWSQLNYWKIQSSIVGQRSDNSYFIQPRSFKFVHQYHKSVLKENIEIVLSKTQTLKVQLHMPFQRKSESLFELETSYENLKKLSIDFKINMLETDEKTVALKVIKNSQKIIVWDSQFQKKNNLLLFNTDLETIQDFKTGLKIEMKKNNFGINTFKGQFKTSLLKEPIELTMSLNTPIKELTVTLTGFIDQQIVMFGKISQEQIVVKLTNDNIQFYLTFESDKNLGFKTFETGFSKSLNMNFKLSRSTQMIKLHSNFEENFIQFSYKYQRELDFDFKLFDTSLAVNLKQISKEDNRQFIIEGKSSFKDWKSFKTELETIFSLLKTEIKASFIKELKEIFKMNYESNYGKSLNLVYSSTYEPLKSGKFELKYESLPQKMIVKFTAESFGTKSINFDFNLDGTSFKAKLTSSFDWIQDVSLNGQLTNGKEEKKGSFSLQHNKLAEPIKGEFSLKVNSEIFQMELKTPFQQPYKELNFKWEAVNGLTTIELANQVKKIFFYKFKTTDNSLYQIDLDLTIPNADLTLIISSTLELKPTTKNLKLKLRSNKFEEFNLEVQINTEKNQYKVLISNPSKEGQIELKTSRFQTKGKTIELLTQYGDMKHELEFSYEIENPNEVHFKSILKSSSFFSSDLSFETNYKHKINLPNELNLDILNKFNGKAFFYKSISWNWKSDEFDLVAKVVLSPKEQEYENKIELSYKRGEIVQLIISASDILSEEIMWKLIRKTDNLELTFKSPFELIKLVNVKLEKEQKTNVWTYKMMISTNKLGKYEMITEYKVLENFDLEISSQINTPNVNKKFSTKFYLKNVDNYQMIAAQFKYDSYTYKINLVRQNQQILIEIDSSFEYLKKFKLLLKEISNSYEIETSINQYQMKLIIVQNKDSLTIEIQTNTQFFKTMSLSIQKSIDKSIESLIITFKIDEKYFKIATELNSQQKLFKLSTENELINSFPKLLSLIIRYSFEPIDVLIQLNVNGLPFFEFEINENQFSFETRSILPEIKIKLTQTKLEIIFLTNNLFSILLERTSNNKISATMMINGNQYSITTIYYNTNEKFVFNLSTYKNSVDKLVILNSEIGKRNLFIDFDLSYQTQNILKLKLFDKISPIRLISGEANILYFNAVSDLSFDIQADKANFKLSWNLGYNQQQFHVGSVVYGMKTSRPLNYLLSVNLQNMAYQAQLLELDNGEIRFKISSPFKPFDIDVKTLFTSQIDLFEFWLSVENSFTGEYTIKTSVQTSKDPEIKLLFSSTASIVKYKLKMITSVNNEFSLNTFLQLFDWNKIEFDCKLSTKSLIDLLVTLNTPWTVAKTIQIKKTINYNSFFEHKYETTIVYDGWMNVKYIGGHEIFLSKKIFKLQGRFHHGEIKILSVDIDHVGNHNNLEHSTIWYFKERKFGVKLNGGFKPLFEGKTEIFTPFHESGKLVLMGKQMENGVEFEAGSDNEKLASFEYMTEKDVRIMKITPPESYGKPLVVQYKSRRFKRNTGNELSSEIMYGTDKILEWTSKIKFDKDKYSALINVLAPKLTQKSAELSLNHKYGDKNWDFDHHLKIKDTTDKLYRFFGGLFQEKSKTFKFSLNTDLPVHGVTHLSFGHSLNDNRHNSHFLVKQNNNTLLMHNGNVKVDFDKSYFNGEWESQINNHRLKLGASHSGSWKRFLQNFFVEYNDLPYLKYKGQVIPLEQSTINIEFPTLNSNQINVMIDSRENVIGILSKSTISRHFIEIKNKNGELKTSYTNDDNKMLSLSIGYATEPLFIKGNYLKHSGKLELTLGNSFVILKLESSCVKISKASVKISKNQVVGEVEYMGKTYKFECEYTLSSDNFHAVMKTSLKPLSILEIQLSPVQGKLTFNQFFITMQYLITKHNLRLTSENNFIPIKNVLLELTTDYQNKASFKLKLNSFTMQANIAVSKEKVALEIENNYSSIRNIEFQTLINVEKDFQHSLMTLSVNKIPRFKAQYQIKDFHYSVGLETYLDQQFIASYNKPSQQIIISLKNKSQYLNIVHNIINMSLKNSKSVIMELNIDSSSPLLAKITNQISYSTTDSITLLKLTSNYNGKLVQFKGEILKSKLALIFTINKLIYNITLTKTTTNEFNLELIIPGHHMKVRVEMNNEKYFLQVKCNEIEITKMIFTQKTDLITTLEHKSEIYVYSRLVWELDLKTDFKMYKIQMKSPSMLELMVVNDWKKSEITTLGFLCKYERNTKFGAGMKFLLTQATRSFEFSIENNYHLINWKKTYDSLSMKNTYSFGLTNTDTKNKWEITKVCVQGKIFELIFQSPTGTKKIKYHQTVEKNVRTSMYLDILGSFKLEIKSDQKSQKLWTGSINLFNQVGTIEIGGNFISAVIKKDNSPEKTIYFKFSNSAEGEWKKTYTSVKTLEITQKSLNINININQRNVMTNSVYSSFTTINYQKIDGTTKTLIIGVSADFSKPNKLSLDFQNPIFPTTVVLQRFSSPTTLRYEIESLSNLYNEIKGYLELKTGSNPGLTTRFYYNSQDPSEFFHAHSKFIEDRQMETHVFIEKRKIKTTYFQFLVRLLNERQLETTFEMKKYILTRLSDLVVNYLTEIKWRTFSELKPELQFMSTEIFNRYNQFLNLVSNEKEINMENKKFYDDIIMLFREIKKMRMKDEFYLDSIFTFVDTIIPRLPSVKVVQIFLYYIDIAYEIVLGTVKDYILQTYFFFFQLLDNFNRFVVNVMREVLTLTFETCYPKFYNYLVGTVQGIKMSYDRTIQKMVYLDVQVRKFSKLFFLSQAYKIIDTTSEILKETVGKLMAGSIEFMKHESDLKELYNSAISKLEDLSKRILETINLIMNQADENLNFLTGDKFFHKLGYMFSYVTDYLIEQLKDKNNHDLVKRFVISSLREYMLEMHNKLNEFTTDLVLPYYTSMSPSNSKDDEIKIFVRYTLPIPINDLKSLPDFGFVTRKINKIKSTIQRLKQYFYNRMSQGNKFREMKNWFLVAFPTPSLPSILPEFERYATISKSSVVTFDKQSFQIKSDACNVLLSKDIYTKKWEIILNQVKGKRSFTVNIGSNTLELSSTDYKIKLNGKSIELPVRMNSLSLIGLGRLIKLVDNSLGLTITVDPTNEMFTVGISQWYHGKVRGLFGNADNEPFNDLMMENGKIVTDKTFMDSFNNQGKSCSLVSEKEELVKPVEGCPFLKRLTCKFLFKCPLSPLGACFKTVDTSNYLKMCINSKEELLTKFDPSVCHSVRQYQSKCMQNGVRIPVPLPCQKCDINHENTLSVNEYKNIKIKDKVSDVVFIIDEGNCLNSLKTKIPDLVKSLETDMKTKGISSVNFGLITFVDDHNNNAMFHTVGQKMLGSSEEMIKSIQALTPSKGIFKDIVGALSLAESYPFRQHSSRHVIMTSCRTVTEHPIRYQIVSEKLKQKAIHFTLLTNFAFKLKDESKKTIIFGVDSTNMYTLLSRNGERNLTTRPENDFLYQLTMNLKGIAFDYNFFNTNQESTKTKFVTALASQISQRATPARSTKCTCVADGEYNCVPQEIYTIFPVKNS